jgi:hypothetical protein
MDALHTYMYKWLLTLMDRGYSYRLSLWCLNATFNNISAISCVSLLVEEIWVLGEKSRPAANHACKRIFIPANFFFLLKWQYQSMRNGRRGRDGMEGGFMTTYGISAYYH